MHDIYKMKLHEIIVIAASGETLQIIRVPGGWLYKTFYYSRGVNEEIQTFVPYHSPGEFK